MILLDIFAWNRDFCVNRGIKGLRSRFGMVVERHKRCPLTFHSVFLTHRHILPRSNERTKEKTPVMKIYHGSRGSCKNALMVVRSLPQD